MCNTSGGHKVPYLFWCISLQPFPTFVVNTRNARLNCVWYGCWKERTLIRGDRIGCACCFDAMLTDAARQVLSWHADEEWGTSLQVWSGSLKRSRNTCTCYHACWYVGFVKFGCFWGTSKIKSMNVQLLRFLNGRAGLVSETLCNEGDASFHVAHHTLLQTWVTVIDVVETRPLNGEN